MPKTIIRLLTGLLLCFIVQAGAVAVEINNENFDEQYKRYLDLYADEKGNEDAFLKQSQLLKDYYRKQNNPSSYYTICMNEALYDTEHNQLREVNPDYLQVIGYAAIVNQWKREMNERVDAATAFDLHVNDRGEVHYDFYLTFEKWLEDQSRDVVIDTKGAAYPEQEARDKKRQDFKTKKMAELVDWVMANTDKKGTEITVLAERIFQRRYA